MSDLNSKGKFNKFIMGKGFYVALAVCLVGAGAAAWVSVDKTISSIESSPLAETPPAQLENTQPAEQKLNDITKGNTASNLPELTENSSAENTPQPPQTPIAQPVSPAESSKEDVPQTEADTSTSLSADASSSQAPDSASDPQSEPVMQSAQQVQQQTSPDSSFALPVNNEIMAHFSGDTLVKNVTLNDWRTHNGIDLKATVGTDVKAASGGTVTSVSTDPLWGNVVEITSGNRVMTYSGLADNIPVTLNDVVSAGQSLGQVGEVPCEITLEPHLHFSVKEDGKFIDPITLVNEE